MSSDSDQTHRRAFNLMPYLTAAYSMWFLRKVRKGPQILNKVLFDAFLRIRHRICNLYGGVYYIRFAPWFRPL